MTFGEALRQAREARGWSRFHLSLALKERFHYEGLTLSERAIKALERHEVEAPRRKTRRMLLAIFPELSQTVPQ
jgi:hypothetical protein